MPFADRLAALGDGELAALLAARPDVLLEPVPEGFAELAERLDGPGSLAAALATVDRDALVVAEAVAVLGGLAGLAEVVALLDAEARLVQEAAQRLAERGLGWAEGELFALPERLAAHLAAEVGAAPDAETAAQRATADGLRWAVAALGADPGGLRKAELVARYGELVGDTPAVSRVLARLSPAAREQLDQLVEGVWSYLTSGYRRPGVDPVEELLRTGLVLPVQHRPVVPREVAVAAWRTGQVLTGRPELPPARTAETRSGARAAAEEAVRAVTTLLDSARAAPVPELKRGGVGVRERAKLTKRLSLPEEQLGLWLDTASEAGLLVSGPAGLVPTGAYDRWREASTAARWAALATAWLRLDHAPTARHADEDPADPPLPQVSAAGLVRRAVLRAARGGRSTTGAADAAGWFCPLTGYDAPDDDPAAGYDPDPRRGGGPDDRDGDGVLAAVARAALREGELLGITVGDAISVLGEHLLDSTDSAADDPAADRAATDSLAARCAELLPESRASVVLQSDLTAVVSGQPSAALADLLAAAATSESRGAASTWRFTPASVRAALDAGWTADELRDGLRAAAEHGLPQPLEYLVADVARRHGSVRVRAVRSCLTGGEAELTELLHTRSLRRLRLQRLAPTVLASAAETVEVLRAVRDAGFAPVAEDEAGTVLVERRDAPPAEDPAAEDRPVGHARPALAADELVRRLRAQPAGPARPPSATRRRLAELGARLSGSELALLADAVDRRRDVVIAYRDQNGTRTIRAITPHELYGRWIDSWCHLRGGQRDFTVANIESVSPG